MKKIIYTLLALLIYAGAFSQCTTFGNCIEITGNIVTTAGSIDTVILPDATDRFVMGATGPVGSAIMDINSTTKGVALPRQTTTQRDAITGPTNGLIVYNTTTSQFNYFDGSTWRPFGTQTGGGCSFDTTIAVNLSSAQILALNGTPISIIAAPPAGYYNKVLNVDAVLSGSSIAYATNTQLVIYQADVTRNIGTNTFTLQDNSNTTRGFSIGSNGAQYANATATFITVAGGNPTAGNGAIKLIIRYARIESSTGAPQCFGNVGPVGPTGPTGPTGAAGTSVTLQQAINNSGLLNQNNTIDADGNDLYIDNLDGFFGLRSALYGDGLLLMNGSDGTITVGDGAANVNGTSISIDDPNRRFVINSRETFIGADTVTVTGDVLPQTISTANIGSNDLPFDSLFVDHAKIISGAGSGKVLTSDADGNAYWGDAPVVGVYSQNGNGSATDFDISLPITPQWILVTAGSEDAAGPFWATVGANKITVHYLVAPASGTNNVIHFYQYR